MTATIVSVRFPPELMLEVDKVVVIQSAKVNARLSRNAVILSLIEQGLERVGATAPKKRSR